VAGLPFTQTGQYTEVLENFHGCDSTINLDLTTIICEIQGDVATESVACFGGTNGSLVFYIDDGTPPFSYSWQKLGDPTYAGNGNLGALNQNVSIPGLPQGTYLITVTDNFGNDAVLIGDITEAPPLTAIFEVSDFNGFGVTCADSATATLTVLPAGGNGGFSYVWSNQATAADLTGLAAGTYTVLITDIAGCTLTASAVITEPAPMVFTAIFTDPNCDGLETGSIALDNISGGVPPYLFSLNDADFAPQSSFTDLGPDNYTFTATDTNGCQVTLTSNLDAPIIPVIDLGGDVAIELGDNIGLFITCNILPDTIIWQPDPGLSCYDCLGPNASPLNPTIYSVAVSSEDDCWDADTITVNVLKVRDVFVPNTFTPNYDGHNDFFTVFGGNEVDRVLTFKVFDRWGELLFETADMPANDLDTGWDGRYRGKFVDTGIYVWFAEVRFIDGLTLRYEGDVNVLR
jgi:gliding motility-associated-like protein